MKERENELTTSVNLTNLETGEIFMAEGGEGSKPNQGEIKKPERITPEDTVGRLAKLQAEEMIKKGITFPPGWENADVGARNAYIKEMSARAAAKETTFTRDGDQSVTIIEKPVRKPRAPRKVKETEKQPAEPTPQHAEGSKSQQIKEAIEAVKRGEVPIDPATGDPLVVLTQEHAIKALEQQLKESEQVSQSDEGGSGGGKEIHQRPELSEEQIKSVDVALESMGMSEEERANLKAQYMQENSRRSESMERRVEDKHKQMKNELDAIKEATTIEELQVPLESFLEDARFVESIDKESFDQNLKDKIETIEKYRDLGNLEEIKKIVLEISPKVKEHYLESEAGVPDIPESLEDLVRLIMRTAGAEWKTGDKALMKEGVVVKENFIRWIRDRMIFIHNFNPNSEVNFFSDITVKGRWSNITFYEMAFYGSYFLEKAKTNKGIVDEDGNRISASTSEIKPNEDYESLKNQLINEVFLFQYSRNFHVKYTQPGTMGSEEGLSKALGEMYSTNIFTRSNFLETILTMPSVSKRTSEENSEAAKGKEIATKLKQNDFVGEATRRLLLSYYYIHDYEMLSKILGNDAVIFKKEYEDIDSVTGKQKKGKPPKASHGKRSGSHAYHTDAWYDDQGKLKLDQDKPDEHFMEYINVFTGPGPQKDANIVTEVRERMAQSIMKTMGIGYDEAKYAESWAFSMTRWSGLGAKNDVKAVGHDAWTKALNFQEYRLRQLAEHRNAQYGNIFNLLGIKRAGLNLFEGIKDTNGRTIIEAIQGKEGSEYIENISYLSKPEEEKISFNEGTMSGFYANHLGNSFALVEALIDHQSFRLEDVTTIDATGRTVIDYEKANKVIGGLEKAIRYWASTWGGTDYSKTVRTWETRREKARDDYGVEYVKERTESVELPIFAELFSSEIIGMLQKEADKRENEYISKMTPDNRDKYIKDKRERQEKHGRFWDVPNVGNDIDFSRFQEEKVRQILWKAPLKYLLETEIESHRNFHSDQERFNFQKIETIYSFIEQKGWFRKDETSEMRKESLSTVRAMMTEEGALALGSGFLRALMILISQLNAVTK